MRTLFDAIPVSRQGAHAADSGALASIVAAFITPGDAILVKGSLGSGMRRVIEAIDAVTSRPTTVTAGAG
jgi:UDP-N-acetylmuramoyl-tripeptide--D-alanyl-D-alanine ligase